MPKSMETAILLGIPEPYVRRLKVALKSFNELQNMWSILFVPTPKKGPEISGRMATQACKLADANPNPHIFGFSTQRNRDESVAEIIRCFRFRWSKELVALLGCLSSQNQVPFLERLKVEMDEELQWSELVRPRDTGSPLLLPECSFSASDGINDLWRHARSYGDLNNIVGAEKTIKNFRQIYLRKEDYHRWIDGRGLIFDRNGPRHAAAQFPRGWKFSYRLPHGFHYDVTHCKNRKFSICDAEGVNHVKPANTHINIDPHGYVRG